MTISLRISPHFNFEENLILSVWPDALQLISERRPHSLSTSAQVKVLVAVQLHLFAYFVGCVPAGGAVGVWR